MSDKLRTICISDAHACIDELKELLKKVQYKKEEDRLIICGDAINRGPGSLECIRLIRELGAEMIMGNHENHFLRWYKGKQDPYWLATRPHYAQFSDEDVTFINNLPLYIKIAPNFYAVHAGIKPGITVEQQRREDLLYLRYTDDERNTITLKQVFDGTAKTIPRFWTEFGPFGNNSLVYGHCVFMDGPRIDKFDNGTTCYGIDTGCVFGGALSCIILHDDVAPEIVRVKAKKAYYKSKF